MYSWGAGYRPSPDLVHSLDQLQAIPAIVPGCGQVRLPLLPPGQPSKKAEVPVPRKGVPAGGMSGSEATA